jgi:ribonuclease P protein component
MNNFPKGERINNVKEIENLYAKGDKFMAYPFSVRFIYNKEQNNDNPKMSVLIVAPKRYQKLAVNRNRAKRLLREAYRLNKNELQTKIIKSSSQLLISIALVSKTIPDYKLTEQKVKEILSTIEKKIFSENN